MPFLPPGDLPDAVIEPASPALQADSLSNGPLGKSPNVEVTAKASLEVKRRFGGNVDVLSVQSNSQEVMANTQCVGGEMKPPPFQAGDWPAVGMG